MSQTSQEITEQQKAINETVVQGHKFNIANALKKASSYHSSQEDLSTNRRSRHVSGQTMAATKSSRQATSSSKSIVVGCALKGLDAALDALANEQKAQEAVANKYQSKRVVVSENGDGVTSVTVSLPSSKKASRRGSVDLGSGGQQPLIKQRSRRNSIDLYSADYNIKLVCDKATENHKQQQQQQSMKMVQRSSSHIRVDDIANSKLKLCPRCHSPHHGFNECTEFGDLKCPRCMEWAHWEDSCWANDDPDDLVSDIYDDNKIHCTYRNIKAHPALVLFFAKPHYGLEVVMNVNIHGLGSTFRGGDPKL
jgi:hypothetical protein